MPSLLLAVIITTAGPQFEVQTLDGRAVAGSIVELSADRLTIHTDDGRVSLEMDNLLGLSAKEAPAPTTDEPGAWVELVDGSALIVRDYAVQNGQARITLLSGQPVELPTADVTSVHFHAHSGEVASEWSRITQMELEGDLLVVRKDETIDYHKGVLRDVTEETVQFELDGEVLPVKRSKVHGLVYCHPSGRALPEAVCELTDTSGSRWSVRSLTLPGDLEWTTPVGVTVTRPLAMVSRIDFSRGKIVFLSDLEPESVAFTPFFGTSEDLPLLAKFYAPRKDKNLESGPLQLDKKTYNKGLALHSRTRLVYRLPGRFSRFSAVVGIDDGVRPRGNVRLVISGDDKVLLATTVTGTDPPKPVELELTGVRRLAILADFGEQLDVADHLDLCEARILK